MTQWYTYTWNPKEQPRFRRIAFYLICYSTTRVSWGFHVCTLVRGMHSWIFMQNITYAEWRLGTRQRHLEHNAENKLGDIAHNTLPPWEKRGWTCLETKLGVAWRQTGQRTSVFGLRCQRPWWRGDRLADNLDSTLPTKFGSFVLLWARRVRVARILPATSSNSSIVPAVWEAAAKRLGRLSNHQALQAVPGIEWRNSRKIGAQTPAVQVLWKTMALIVRMTI